MHNQRKIINYLIDPKFQLVFVSFLVVISLVLSGIFLGIAYYFIRENYSIFVDTGVFDEKTISLFKAELAFVTKILGVVGIFYLIGITLLGIVFSHRVAGPMYKLRTSLMAYQKGSPVDRAFSFRSGDFYFDIGKLLGEFFRKYALLEDKLNEVNKILHLEESSEEKLAKLHQVLKTDRQQ